MKIQRFVWVSALIILLLAPMAGAQERFLANANFTMGFPQNEFKVNVDRLAYGGSAYFIYRLPQSPVGVGVSFDVRVYGSEHREEPFSSAVPDVFVDIKTRNYMLMSHILLRLLPFEGYLRPYVDGLIGLNHIWTHTGVYDWDEGWDEEIAGDVIWSDTAFSYGMGAGVMIRILQTKGARKGNFAIDLDCGFRYIKGGNAEYLTEGAVVRQSGQAEYYVSESNTDVITAHFGFTFAF